MSISRITCVIVTFLLIHTYSYATTINKGDIDDRVYRYQVLENQLKVLFISDPNADKAAAALNVEVGSYHDPVDRQGLAHFLEHMLFLGTKKYPEADEYQAFISDSGGSHNAYTSSHNTNYFFDVENKQLDAALDRFSQFFVAPLFDEFYVDRERNAVHSEYQARIQDDSRRGYDVYRSVINPKHPQSKFNVGSLTTLADRPKDLVRDDLLTFYQQHYSANKMSLVVLGNYSIAELRKMVEQRFAEIPLNKDAHNESISKEALFESGRLPMEVLSRPIKELREMTLSFSLPSIAEYYKEKPLDFVAYILGHEGKGSLLSLLKQQGFAEGLSAGGHDKNDGTSAFYVTIQLTKKGIEQRDTVRALVFYAIEQIKQSGVEPWRYEEKKLLSHIAFRFRETPSAIDTVKSLSNNLTLYPAPDVISGDYLLENFDEALIQRLLSELKPENVFVSTVFPEAETNKRSEYYSTPYSVHALDKSQLEKSINALPEKLTQSFALPEKNPFIPEALDLYATDEDLSKPKQIFGEKSAIWAKQDTSYKTPRVNVRLRVLSPLIAGNLKGAAKAELYVELLRDRLNEYSYPALLAGATINLNANNRGIDITVEGYHDRLYKLMEVLLGEIEQVTIDPQRFEQLKQDTIREWRNNAKKTPYHQLYNQLAVNLYKPYWSDAAKIDALTDVDREEMLAFAKAWRVGAELKALFYGNFNQTWLNDWQAVLTLQQALPEGEEKTLTPIRVAKLDHSPSQYDVKTVDHTDSAIALYVQGSDDTLQSQAKMMVLRQILQSPFYSTLRTEQQLGYIVFLGSLQLREVPGSVFVVQSPTANVDAMRAAINAFIADFSKQLPDDISTYQRAVVTQLLESPPSLSASANNYWSNLLRGNTEFDDRQKLAEQVNTLNSTQLKDAYKSVIQNTAKSLWVYSKQPEKVDKQTPFTATSDAYVYP